MNMKLLLILCALPAAAPFAPPSTITSSFPHENASAVKGPSLAEGGEDAGEDDGAPSSSSVTSSPINNIGGGGGGGSDLKSLLPTARKRTLRLDKFGRRVHDLTDDGTTQYSKPRQSGSSGVVRPSSSSPDAVVPLNSKELAADASSAEFVGVAATVRSDGGDEGGGATKKDGGGDGARGGEMRTADLRSLMGGTVERNNYESAREDARLGEGNRSVDLKALLPKQKMKFMKLDKFGRRVQQMEDDGTVNFVKDPSAQGAPVSSASSSGGDGAAGERATTEDAPSGSASATEGKYGSLKGLVRAESETGDAVASSSSATEGNYGSLKKLVRTKRATWTKLDFHGRSVEDERRTSKLKPDRIPDNADEPVGEGGNLTELLPKRAIWTKLDFRGASVVDERRTKNAGGSDGSGFNKGGYSNLRSLVPNRTINWKKKGQVLSSGSAPGLGQQSRGLREERQDAIRGEVMASAASNAAVAATGDSENADSDATVDEYDARSPIEEKGYSNLKTLLPERTITWKKGQVLSSGSSPTVSKNVRGLREERGDMSEHGG